MICPPLLQRVWSSDREDRRWSLTFAGWARGALPILRIGALSPRAPSWSTWLALTGALAAAGCGGPSTPIAPADPRAVLNALVSQGAVPALTRLAEEADALDAAVRRLCRNPREIELEMAREAWQEAYLAWRGAAPYMFGPADEVTMKRRLGSWPVNEIVLDHVVASDEFSHMRGADDVRGYAALEFLLYLPVNAEVATADQRCPHLTNVTHEIKDLTAGVWKRWTAEYGYAFVGAGEASSPIPTQDDALALVFAEGMNVTERLLWERIGVPSGFFRGADSLKLETIEAPHAGIAREGLRETLEALRRLAAGADGQPGLAALIVDLDPARASDMVRRAERALAELQPDAEEAAEPLSATLRRQPSRLEGLYRQIQALQDQFAGIAEVLTLPVQTHQDGD